MNTYTGYSSDFESCDFLLDIKVVLQKHYYKVRYVLHKECRLSLEEYEVILRSLRGHSHDKIVREICDDRIVGEGWWYAFKPVCCADPNWHLYIHPDYE